MDIETPFLHNLDTNHVPSQAHVPVIRSLLQDHQKPLDALDAQIAALTATRNARATFVQRHIALASPIKRLPNDVLSSLFIALWAGEPENGDMSPTSPGVVLSHVCRRWRQLALATPTLWSALKIHSPPLHRVCTYSYGKVSRNDAARSWEREVKRILATSCVWIERSKSCPLSLDIDLPHLGEALFVGVKPPLNTGDLPLLVEVICDVSSRWRKAIIRLPANSSAAAAEWPYTRFVALTAGDVPLLRELAIIQPVNDLHMPPPAISPIQQGLAIIGAHSLHSLSFGPLRVPLVSLSVRWDQLTSLTFNGRVIGHGVSSFGVNEALTLFRMCPRLVTCDILMYITDVPDYAAHAGTIRMRYLESLTFRYSVPGRAFMRYVDLPSLHTLRLPNLIDGDFETAEEDPWNPLQEWLEAYGVQLKVVEFNMAYLAPVTLDACMGLLKGVVELRLLCRSSSPPFPPRPPPHILPQARIDGEFLARLGGMVDDTTSRSEDIWCPNLEVVHFPKHRNEFTEEDLLEFIVARSRASATGGCARLRQVDAVFDTLQTIDIPARLGERGVDVNQLECNAVYASRLSLFYYKILD